MNYQKALTQFAFLGGVLPIVILIGIYYFYDDLQTSIAEHEKLHTKLTAINNDINATQRKVTAYQPHKEILQRLHTIKPRTSIPSMLNLLNSYGIDKTVLQYRLGFGEENASLTAMKQFTSSSINLQLVGRYNTLLKTAYALEQANPSLFVTGFVLANNSPGTQPGQVDQPLALTLNYGVLNIPPIP
ncbi:MAG: hypothetical protein PW734_01225 [Verrucomicrobium sp.]|nr:hypothetical protein [Verrucomicrobium sp.]